MKKPKRIFRARRGECPESAAFRHYMKSDDGLDRALEVFRRAGFDPATLDFDRLIAVSKCLGHVLLGDQPVVVLEPLPHVRDHLAFDAAVIGAGVTRFIRRGMPSGQPVEGLPIDPSLRLPDTDAGDWIAVGAIGDDRRARAVVDLESRGKVPGSSL